MKIHRDSLKWNSVGHQRKSIGNQNDGADQRIANKITGTTKLNGIHKVVNSNPMEIHRTSKEIHGTPSVFQWISYVFPLDF